MGGSINFLSLQILFTLQVLILTVHFCSCTTLYPKRYLPNADSLAPAISLHVSKNYNGKELFFDGTVLSLTHPRPFRSHRFTGKINWTLYPHVNFTGQPVCLVADQTFPVTFNADFDVLIGSIRRGCWCNYSITVTPKPRGEVKSGTVRLWTKRNGYGYSVLTDGQETRLPDPIAMNSFQSIGPWKEWTAFTMNDLSGDPKCLATTRKTGDGWSWYTNTPISFTVGSIQQACIAESAKFEMFDEDYHDVGSKTNVNVISLGIVMLSSILSAFFPVLQM